MLFYLILLIEHSSKSSCFSDAMTFAIKTVVEVILIITYYMHEIHESDRLLTIFRIQLHQLQMKKSAILVSSIYIFQSFFQCMHDWKLDLLYNSYSHGEFLCFKNDGVCCHLDKFVSKLTSVWWTVNSECFVKQSESLDKVCRSWIYSDWVT